MPDQNSTAPGVREHLRPTLKVGVSGYRSGCRCPGCSAAAKAAIQEYRQRPDVLERVREYQRSSEVRAKRKAHCQKPEVRKRYREYRRRYEQRHDRRGQMRQRLAAVNAIKLGRGCVDCGYKGHPVALDFDHVRGVKLFDISDGYWNRRWDRVLEEIGKCEVVCANCHRIRTYRQKQAVKVA